MALLEVDSFANTVVESGVLQPDARSTSALPLGIDLGSYKHIAVSLDPSCSAYWLAFRSQGVPCFTLDMLRELNQSHRMIHRLVQERAPGDPQPVKFFIACSDTPGVFSLGGDLDYFRKCIDRRDRDALLSYANACVEAMYNNAFGFDVPVVSVGVIEGDALGGGFEAALSINVLIAERGVKMGLPEIVFNSFPGMGAFSFLSRKIGVAAAQKLILSGATYLAEDLYAMGVVDILVDKGEGREAARTYVKENARRHRVLHSLNKVKNRVNPLTLQELRDITEIWVDACLTLEAADLRKMDIFRAAQRRRLRRAGATDGTQRDLVSH